VSGHTSLFLWYSGIQTSANFS